MIICLCLYLMNHDSVLRQQKGTEVSVTLIIGHMIDIKYNQSFSWSHLN